MYRQQTVDVFTRLYDWCNLDPTNIDDETYLLLKKFAGVGIVVLLVDRSS